MPRAEGKACFILYLHDNCKDIASNHVASHKIKKNIDLMLYYSPGALEELLGRLGWTEQQPNCFIASLFAERLYSKTG